MLGGSKEKGERVSNTSLMSHLLWQSSGDHTDLLTSKVVSYHTHEVKHTPPLHEFQHDIE